MCSGAGRDRTLAGLYVLCLQLVGAAFMATRGRPQGSPLRPDTLGRACSAEVNAPGRGSRFILGWRVFHGNLFGSVFLPCLRRPRFLAEESGGKDGSGRGIPISPAPTPHPLKRPIRGAAAPLLDVPPGGQGGNPLAWLVRRGRYGVRPRRRNVISRTAWGKFQEGGIAIPPSWSFQGGWALGRGEIEIPPSQPALSPLSGRAERGPPEA